MTFLENITIGQYVPADSVIHRLDPRTKIIITLSVMVLAVATTSLRIYLVISIFLLALSFASAVPFAYFFRNLRSFVWLYLVTFILHIFFSSGEVIKSLSFGFINVTHEGVTNGLIYSWRLAIFIFCAALLSLTTQAVELTDATFKFFSPLKRLKFPVEELSLITMISLRFIPLLLEEIFNLKKAQLSRGASFEGGLIKRVKRTLPLLVPLFVSSFRKAEELALALDARGFRSGQARTSFQRLNLGRADYLVLSLVIIIIATSYWLKRF
jgi:energy-coupling factor transport system permease protein